MLTFPVPTTREEKFNMMNEIKDRLLSKHGTKILAIGVYGSIGQEKDGPYSDIEMHVVLEDGIQLEGHEFIYDKFKIEIGMDQKKDIFKEAAEIDESWPIKAGSFVHITPLYDPTNLFEELKKMPFQASDAVFKVVMREFMIWEPYETVGKLRNNFMSGNFDYLTLGAKDLVWQTAKLIGLANRKFFTTRARTFEESLLMESRPAGYDELVRKVMAGTLEDKEYIYQLCEKLWTGLNEWFAELGIEYKVQELPF
ncbi:kanamycin nucleotidyltransferase C-terminal domain-containing protein [Heyndrickxia sporothermodurans]|uniref:kanamycin nucleotidyltransferase C-terminal domain-containing protein n=1 Tax=Heyndrickxia sporothermodurans TaxID=46224 RepID=UPI0035DA1247